jgi:uncharacterized protein
MHLILILLLQSGLLPAAPPTRMTTAPRTIPGPALGHEALHEAERDYRDGVRLAEGKGVERDYAAAARLYRRAAEKGHIAAQYSLAYLFEHGLGLAEDAGEAAYWYRKAALQGDAESQVNLGVLYATGAGVTRDDVQAVRWYRLAAEQHDLRGMSNLGSMYLQGRGVSPDSERALVLFREAAQRGYAIAQNNLALLYANGEGVAQNYEEAWAWLDLAAESLPAAANLRDRIAAEMKPVQRENARVLAVRRRAEVQAYTR